VYRLANLETLRCSKHTCGERGILLTKPHDLCFGGVQNQVKGRESFVVERLTQNPGRPQLSLLSDTHKTTLNSLHKY
jgi:hypothetical protein